MKKMISEIIGTFALLFFGCGSILFLGESVTIINIAFAFGITVTLIAYSLGSISGAHLNPAVSIGMLISNKITFPDFILYIISQIIGALLAVILLSLLSFDVKSASTVVGSYGVLTAIIFELIASFFFVFLILRISSDSNTVNFSGLIIGLSLFMIHIVGIPISGASVNPARSIATNIFGVDEASLLWLYIIFPLLGGLIAGFVYNFFEKEKN
tara:strand:- start:257 stop:895 length:639 start_codon:yes stop_codon:yes gene_type:complete